MRNTAFGLLLVLAAGCASAPVPSDAPLAERERLLLQALVNAGPATLNHYLTDDFSCDVRGPKDIRLAPSVQRFTLCTGYGHQRPPGGGHDNRELDLRKSAIIRSMDVQEGTDRATVVMEQSYFGWVPYDGAFERRSRVTDTWVRRGGDWRIAKRVTEPLT
jgi:Domain of unknown function (DUF4440)